MSDRRSAAGRATTGAAPVDKMAADDVAAVSAASSEGPLGLLPQLGDSEEKLRQVRLLFCQKAARVCSPWLACPGALFVLRASMIWCPSAWASSRLL